MRVAESAEKSKVRVITHIPSPYQVELFDAIARSGKLEFEVCYLYSKNLNRMWGSRDLQHAHIFLEDDPKKYLEIERSINDSNLIVFHYYQHSSLLELIKKRAASGKSWCFWGERPGYRRLGWLGVIYRRWVLSVLHHNRVPIWGMGKWAVEKYRQEYGENRLYCNVPYFSDLSRFKRIQDGEHHPQQRQRRFLYSGSLIHRKGVDLLAGAFSRLADEFPDVSLSLIGEGELRETLERQLAQFGDRVEFKGFREWEDLPQFYSSSDILCVPSRYDGWNLVVPEGLAAGLPVISTDKTGAAIELIVPGENGWVVPAGNAEALYQAMRKAALLTDASMKEHSLAAEASVAQHTVAEGVDRFHGAVKLTLDACPTKADS